MNTRAAGAGESWICVMTLAGSGERLPTSRRQGERPTRPPNGRLIQFFGTGQWRRGSARDVDLTEVNDVTGRPIPIPLDGSDMTRARGFPELAGLLISLAPLALLAACGGGEPAGGEARGNVDLAASDPAGEKLRAYVAAVAIRVCPQASDFEESITQSTLGNLKHPLPARCSELPAGSTVLLSATGKRPRVEYHGFPVEQGALAGAKVVWSDQFGSDFVRRP